MGRRDFLKGTVAAAVVAATPVVAEAVVNDKPVCLLRYSEVFQPVTADELVEQMRRWRAGELDRHDVVVAVWRDRALAKHSDLVTSEVGRVREARARWERTRRSRLQYGLPLDNDPAGPSLVYHVDLSAKAESERMQQYRPHVWRTTPKQEAVGRMAAYEKWLSVGFPA